MSKMKVGSTVQFRNDLYPDEEGEFYRVLELNGDRCFIEHIGDEYIESVSVALLSELVLVKKEA